MSQLKRILIMAGGTGGHIFPGLAIAKRLLSENIEVQWLGTQTGLEAKLVPDAGIPIHFITINGVRGKGIKDILLAPPRLLIAIFQAARIIRQFKPDIVLGMGGFVSGPGGIACWLLGRPLIIHEQNAKPGTTNKWLAKIAKKVLEGFPNTFLKRQNVVTVGNPIRTEIIDMNVPERGVKDKRTLLVIGGSLGALAINKLLPRTLALLPEFMRPEVYHQTGEKHYSDTQAAYQQAGVSAKIVPFIKEMHEAYAWADIVLCRSGALTIAELCAAGVGAILVPFPHAIGDHQTANANFMVKEGAALLIQQSALTADKLVDILQEFIELPERCQAMAKAAYQLRRADAADKILSICQDVYKIQGRLP
ncbi:MAG TPA: undecaprenyldiphospho-muramoylpentapeptide beta-N-acetylglucosaminyltransferase [Gammaproteobacteria bacterium]|nr:undecaprenyldiphospho-muramoylpentapeptide beta-N-acetylglucosaminyltransferase [Gammaproteobacteria bacterium]